MPTQIEKDKMAQIQQNNQVLDELKVKRMVSNLNSPTAQKFKEKYKVHAECDDYISKNENED